MTDLTMIIAWAMSLVIVFLFGAMIGSNRNHYVFRNRMNGRPNNRPTRHYDFSRRFNNENTFRPTGPPPLKFRKRYS